MKKNYLIIYTLELLLLIYLIIFKTIIFENLRLYINIINILFFGVLTFTTYKLLGFPRSRQLISRNIIQNMIICFIIYYFLTYLFGLFFGYLTNPYSLKILNVLKNIFFAVIVYLLKETYRYMIVKKVPKGKKTILILTTLLLAGFDILMQINSYDLSSRTGIFEMVESCIIPSVSLSALLTFLSYKLELKLALIFLILYDLPKYFLPIFPDMGNYIGSVVKLIFMFAYYYNTSVLLEKYDRQITSVRSIKKNKILIVIIIPLLIMIGLVSGFFKYHLLAIASNSMLPYFSRGDVVLIEKLKTSDYENLKVGDVLAFYYNNRIIVHRIISIDEENGQYKIKTKGDNNDSPDAWIVKNKDIYGKVRYIVKYIGIPSVELSELIN